MKILGISCFYHDSAAAIIEDGRIIAAAQEERFTRIKHDDAFPSNAIHFCLDSANTNLDELDAVAFYDKPFLKLERLLETYYAFAPKGWSSFITAIPVWLKEKLFMKRLIREELEKIEGFDKKKLLLLFPEHHLSHAASAFYPSAYQNAAILTIDGVGEWATASISHGTGKNIKILKELRFPHSLGLLYSAFTYFLGFKVNSGEYKLMGLAPYGNTGSERVKHFKEVIRDKLVDIKPDGSIWLNRPYFTYATGLRMVPDKKWEKLFGFPKRKAETEIQQHHCDLAMAIQEVTEEIVLLMAKEAKQLTGEENLCMAGGVALNCVANGNLQRSGIFKNLFIQPAAGDAGGALGAALAAYHIYFDKERLLAAGMDAMQGSFLGPECSSKEIIQAAKKYGAVYNTMNDATTLCRETARLLNDGNIIGWVQGRMEFGPRALGARSILGDARNAEMQKKLNLKIKFRESFRPFAPAVLAEDVNEYFDLETISPYMLLIGFVNLRHRNPLPENYAQWDLKDKLYFLRSDLPAITHIDYSARIQTVDKENNPLFHQLLSSFKSLTGYPVLVNTSFNVRGEPIVNTPEDAYRCFMRTEMDYLVMGNFIFDKKLQPQWKESEKWKQSLIMD